MATRATHTSHPWRGIGQNLRRLCSPAPLQARVCHPWRTRSSHAPSPCFARSARQNPTNSRCRLRTLTATPRRIHHLSPGSRFSMSTQAPTPSILATTVTERRRRVCLIYFSKFLGLATRRPTVSYKAHLAGARGRANSWSSKKASRRCRRLFGTRAGRPFAVGTPHRNRGALSEIPGGEAGSRACLAVVERAHGGANGSTGRRICTPRHMISDHLVWARPTWAAGVRFKAYGRRDK
jgi:hypothetical protein